MLLWSKYLIFDCIDEGIILWSTVNSQGVVVKNECEKIQRSISEGKWDYELGDELKRKFVEYGFLLTKEQHAIESKLIDRMRSESVYDDTFMSLTIIPTDRCNFRCLYCYQSDTYHDMSEDVAKSILKMIKNSKSLRKLHISWFGGEPLCNKDLVISLMKDINTVCNEQGC